MKMRTIPGVRVDVNGLAFFIPKIAANRLAAAIDLIGIDIRETWPQMTMAQQRIAIDNVIHAYLEQRT